MHWELDYPCYTVSSDNLICIQPLVFIASKKHKLVYLLPFFFSTLNKILSLCDNQFLENGNYDRIHQPFDVAATEKKELMRSVWVIDFFFFNF